jgi:hypothetical protein
MGNAGVMPEISVCLAMPHGLWENVRERAFYVPCYPGVQWSHATSSADRHRSTRSLTSHV